MATQSEIMSAVHSAKRDKSRYKRDVMRALHSQDIICDLEHVTALYNAGYIPPAFPVPAILGRVHTTDHAVYIANPQGYDCIALWSRKYGQRTI